MLRARAPPLLLLLLLLLFLSLLLASALGNENGFNCNCDDEGFWSVPTILECQKVSDFLIAVAYFSIPIELLYFVSFSNVPFKWVLVQFIAFIVLCGLTHLLNGWTYYGPHSFQLMLSLTIAKFLTALVSCATAITLLTLIPLLLKWKVRELFLRQNVLELDQEVGMMKKQKEASWHVRMLTREIRKSLDKHTILHTTMVELSKTLDLTHCAVWMPNENFTAMNLTHELKASSSQNYNRSIPISDPDVIEIKKSEGVVILQSDSSLAAATGGGGGSPDEAGPVAAIRMPLLQVSNFKGGTPELVDTRYAILVLVLPGADSRKWTGHEMEIVEVVADQVAVALSHAAVLEESQFMRDKLREQNRAFQQAKRNAMMASAARNSFQKVMSHGMRRPMHSIMGLLSILQDHETLGSEQKLLVDSMTKTSSVLSTLISDAMEISAQNDGKFRLEMRPFQLHSLIKEASCLARCLCIYKRFGFSVDVQGSLPDHVMGDESRTFQMILHMFGYLLDIHEGGGTVIFRVFSANGGNDGKNERVWGLGMPSMPGESINVKFEIEISRGVSSTSDASVAEVQHIGRVHSSNTSKDTLSFTVFKKLAQMQGKILTVSNSQRLPERMTLILPFPLQSLRGREYMLAQGNNPDQQQNILRGLNILLSDDDDVNRIVTRKQLEKLGCQVTAVSSGFECLSALRNTDSSFRVVLLDLHMPDIDGFEVAMRIRKFKSRSRSRSWPLIIALTTSAEERITDKCIQAGMNGMVRKPAVLQTLADEILQALNRAGGI